jgi:hypothetical protein
LGRGRTNKDDDVGGFFTETEDKESVVKRTLIVLLVTEVA